LKEENLRKDNFGSQTAFLDQTWKGWKNKLSGAKGHEKSTMLFLLYFLSQLSKSLIIKFY